MPLLYNVDYNKDLEEFKETHLYKKHEGKYFEKAPHGADHTLLLAKEPAQRASKIKERFLLHGNAETGPFLHQGIVLCRSGSLDRIREYLRVAANQI